MANECWSSKDTSKGYELICIVHVHLSFIFITSAERMLAKIVVMGIGDIGKRSRKGS